MVGGSKAALKVLPVGPSTRVHRVSGDRTPHDAISLFNKLEEVVIPLFYRNRSSFIDTMRHAIALNGSFFSTQRMLLQYVLKAYFS